MSQIQAIETHYKGYRFRSRLEARWAVFFDTLGVVYEYEKEGYKLDGLYYLPDFWLPDYSCWIEIKGQEPTSEEDEKCERLVKATQFPLYLFHGSILVSEGECSWAYAFLPGGGWDNYHMWCECPDCKKLGIQFEGRSDRLPCKECYRCAYERAHCGFVPKESPEDHCAGKCRRHDGNLDRCHTSDSLRLCRAYAAGRSARFEKF